MKTDHVHDEYCAVDSLYCATSQVHKYGFAVIKKHGTTMVIDFRTGKSSTPESENPDMSETGAGLLVYGFDLGSWNEIQPQLDAKTWPYGGEARPMLESGMQIDEFLNLQLVGDAGKYDEYTALGYYDQPNYLDRLPVQAVKYGDDDSNGVMLAAKVYRGAGMRFTDHLLNGFKVPYWEPQQIVISDFDALQGEVNVRRAAKLLGIKTRTDGPVWMLAHTVD